ncbi:MAG: CBS domain-containing protein, partial [Alphaproteobacteria bacterium]|nr:CBS domain-containing protein [Alphaproteobacteria bacterium]
MTDKSVSDSDEEGSIRATAISTGSSFSGSSQGNPQGNSQGNTPGSIKRSGLKGLLKSLFSRNGDSQLRETFEEILEEIDEQEGIDNSFGEGARTILANIVKAGDATAEDVMVPRADIASIDDSTPLLDAISIMVEMPHSRYPIYHETPDNVIGMVHIKDVLRAFKERSETGALPVSQDKNFALESIRREVMFVAPSIRILDLLLEMRES